MINQPLPYVSISEQTIPISTNVSTLEVCIGPEEFMGPSNRVTHSAMLTNVTPVVTLISSTQRQNSLEEEAWKIITRKSKDKGKQAAYQSARILVQYELQSGMGISVGVAGAKGPNPYLS